MAPRSQSISRPDPYPKPMGPHLVVNNETVAPPSNDTGVTFEDGAMKIEHPDGSVTIKFDGGDKKDAKNAQFDANLAEYMDEGELGSIATDLMEGIMRDDDSRREWLETRALGISLLGLKLERPRSDAGSSQAPLEGMSTVRNPLLLEATISFQSTARGELLPAAGPVKVRNDSTIPPQDIMPTNAAQELGESLRSTDDLAQAYEKDWNHYLTAVATEYYPDTDRMLFHVGFGGDGFKKVYNCPLKRRPVSESVDAEDLIVSNAATDLHNCGRITHRIKMRKSILRRMQILKVYRDVDLAPPMVSQSTVVDRKKEEVAGYNPINQKPEDRDYEIYEAYCELDIPEFAPRKFKNKGLPLPYRVTLEKESRKILDIRRNWKEDDEQCMAKRFFVQFPFIRGLGFYGLGYVHVLGNTTNALTGAWRLMLDSGMFANFPGFLFVKGAGRQNTNQFRIPPGGGVGLDVPAQMGIKDAVMPLPYKEVGPAFTSFLQQVEEGGRRLASTANISVGEGKQDAPVGTTLALIEQASKVIDSAHKRLHAAQAEEFSLLRERFSEDPEAFWRHNKRPAYPWQKDQFIQALENYNLVPVADPNNPTSLHRIAKAMAIKTLQQSAPDLYDPVAVDMRIMRIVDIDPQGLFRAQPAPQPPDPRMVAIQAKAQAEQQRNQIAQGDAQIKAMQLQMQALDKQKDRESRERLEQMKIELQKLKIQQEQIIHAHDELRDRAMMAHTMQQNQIEQAHKLRSQAAETHQGLQHEAIAQQHELHGGIVKTAAELEMDRQRHDADMERAREKHAMDMEHAREMHQAKLEAAKAMAKAKPKKEKSGGSKAS